MFRELKLKYENSLKEKADLLEYVKDVHRGLMEMKDLSALMDHPMVSKTVIDSKGIYIVLHTGIKMYINPTDYGDVSMTCLCTGKYEVEETEMVMDILQHYGRTLDFTVLDIGANVGWYTLNIMKRYPNMKVYSFEPAPITYTRLHNNLELNGLSTVGLWNCGFSKEKGMMDFYYDKEASGASSMVNIRENPEISKICVSVDRLDSWVCQNKVKHVDFIKCDVEGAEFFVYEGGRETIKKYHPIIFSEMLRKWSAKFGYHPNDIIQFMAEMGYLCFGIRAGGRGRLVPLDFVTEETLETNYFFLHSDKHKDLIFDLS